MSQTLQVTSDDVWAMRRAVASQRMAKYVQWGWPIVEPDVRYVHGWHMDAMCEHLEAAARFEIQHLAIAIPPGMAKSLVVSVFFPTWVWTWAPARRFITTSYAERLTSRDTARSLALLKSDWYQELWGEDFHLTRESNLKIENSRRGFREAMPFTSLTGSRGDYVLIDDPLSVDDADSPAVREKVGRTFLEAVPTRVNDPQRSAFIVIQQRLHADDVIGLAVARELGYTVLELPMEFDPKRRFHTPIGWTDPRRETGELLFPERFPAQVVEKLRATMGSYAWSGQMQQSPAPRGGGMFQEEWLPIVSELPRKRVVSSVRWWDIAGTEESLLSNPDFSVGLKMLKFADNTCCITDVFRDRLSPAQLEIQMAARARADGRETKIRWGKDPGAAGKFVNMYIARSLAGYNVRGIRESGSKVKRAEPLAAQAEAGNICLLRGKWNNVFRDEMCVFPSGSFDDQVDAASGAFSVLAGRAGRVARSGRQTTTGQRAA